MTFSRHNADGKALNPSPFVAHLQRIFPALEVEEFQHENEWREAEHADELERFNSLQEGGRWINLSLSRQHVK